MSVQPSDLLHYLPEFRVIVCTSCQYALQPSAILRHLKDIHHILRSSRKPYAEYIATLDLGDPETILRSTDRLKEFPVPLLPVQQGLRCNYQGCSHLCVTEKRMRNHWTAEHDRPGRPEKDWSSVPLQTLFRGNALRYFTDPSFRSIVGHQVTKKAPIRGNEAAILQHYITSTSLTLAGGFTVLTPDSDSGAADLSVSTAGSVRSLLSPKPRGALVTIWQEVVPQLAETSPFLKQGVLACTALHLAYLCPSERQSYLVTAATHQELAMPLFREAITNIDAQNCHAIIVFVHILAICSFASEQENERLLLVDLDGPDVLCDWLSFLRIGCRYVQVVRDVVKQGPVAALLCEWVRPIDIYEGPQTPLVERLLGVIPPTGCEEAWSEEECQIYRGAVYELDYAFVCAERLGSELDTWDTLRTWPVLLSLDYLQLLQGLHPGALIALAHYCVLLHKLERNWYFEGRTKRLLGHILQRLQQKWHSFVKWPMDSLSFVLT